MPKRTPLACTETNCGDNFSRCGKKSTYTNRKCRCDSCHAANAEFDKAYRKANRDRIAECKRQWAADNRERLAEYKKQYHAENREAITDRRKRYYADNRELLIEKSKRFYHENREAIAERKKIYVENNREAIAKRGKRYRAENRESLIEYERRRRAKDREVIAERKKRIYREKRDVYAERRRQVYHANREESIRLARQWALANPDRYRARSRLGEQRRRARVKSTKIVDFTRDQLDQRMAYYGRSCYLKLDGCTGNFEHVEHVKPIAKGGAHMLANLRPACAPCNYRKGTKWPFNPR